MKLLTLLSLVFLSSSTANGQSIRPYAPELFPENLSGAVCGFSKDGRTIYFVREQPTTHKLWMYEATKSGEKWVNEKLLPFSGVYSDQGGRFNQDRTEFYFTSDRPGGSTDDKDVWNLWKVSKTAKGWGEPVALLNINSRGMECCPLPLSNGELMFSGSRGKEEWQLLLTGSSNEEKTVIDITLGNAWQWPSYEVKDKYLLFNSMKRSDTKGMDDIYISYWKNGKWEQAKNLGEPINTSVYEDGAILSPDGKLLIFCRHDTGETPSKVMCVEWTP